MFLDALQSELLGIDDRTNWNELQGNFCSIIVVRLLSVLMIH